MTPLKQNQIPKPFISNTTPMKYAKENKFNLFVGKSTGIEKEIERGHER